MTIRLRVSKILAAGVVLFGVGAFGQELGVLDSCWSEGGCGTGNEAASPLASSKGSIPTAPLTLPTGYKYVLSDGSTGTLAADGKIYTADGTLTNYKVVNGQVVDTSTSGGPSAVSGSFSCDKASQTCTQQGPASAARAAADSVVDPKEVAAMPEVVACQTAQKGTNSMCNTASMIGITDPVAGAAAEVAVGQLANMAAGMGSNQEQICKNQKMVNEALGVLSGLKGTWCEVKIKSCDSICTTNADAVAAKLKLTPADPKLIAAAGRITSLKTQCDANQANVIGSGIQAAMALFNVVQSGNCAALATPSATPIAAMTPYVITPTNCSDPTTAKTNIVCVCQTTPSNPLCGTNLNAGNSGLNGLNTAGPASPVGVNTPDLSNGGSSVDTTPFAPGEKTNSANAPPGGSSGIGGGGSGGGGGGAGDLAEGMRRPEDKSVITGVTNSSGSGGGGGLFSGGTSGAGGAKAGGSSSGDSSTLGGFNIGRFLPKASGLSGRSPASAALSQDGVTGANGLSLFEKVNAQYQRQTNKLMQSPSN